MFSIDTETGFPSIVLISAAWGLGETIVQGTVNPDEYLVFKPLLCRRADFVPILEKTLGAKERKMVYAAAAACPHQDGRHLGPGAPNPLCSAMPRSWHLPAGRCAIEDHYGRPMDMEWAKDGRPGSFSSSRPGPRPSRRGAAGQVLSVYRLRETASSWPRRRHRRGDRAPASACCDPQRARHRIDSGTAPCW